MSHLLTGFFRQETHKKTAGVKRDYNRLGNQKYSVFSKMDITVGYEPASGSSILSGPANIKFRGIGANWEHMCFASMSKQFESAILHQNFYARLVKWYNS